MLLKYRTENNDLWLGRKNKKEEMKERQSEGRAYAKAMKQENIRNRE